MERDELPLENKMDIQELCAFITYFENIDPDKVCQWKGGEKLEGGAISFPYPVYDEKFMAFIGAFYKSEMPVHDYPKELDRRVPNWQTTDIHKVVETADFELVKIILTKCIRVEKFNSGAWDRAIRSGLFLDILRRLNILVINNKVC